MKITIYLRLIIILSQIMLVDLLQASDKKQFSGINQLTFFQQKYNKAFVGNGFLLRYKNKIYALTVKHALLEAQTPEMKFVDIETHIKEWRIHPNQKSNHSVLLGKLLNTNAKEKIDMNVLTKDWLVFSVKSNDSNLEPLDIRLLPLNNGETLTAYGCSYSKQKSCLQDEYSGSFISMEENNLRISLPDLDLSQLRGLSGSPVLDVDGKLVGVVSNVLKSKSGDGFDFAPANLDYLMEILNHI